MCASFSAVILAAGHSSRMGAFKPLLPLGDSTVVQTVASTYQEAGINDIIVVAGNRADEIVEALKKSRIRTVVNQSWRDGMFTSVLSGIRNLAKDCRAFMVHPVDIPLVRARTIRLIIDEYTKRQETICRPVFQGLQGHPPLIPTKLVKDILSFNGSGGLKVALANCRVDSTDVPVWDENILIDMDEPEDYREIQARLSRINIPNRAECKELMTMHQGVDTLNHCLAVSRAALLLGQRLEKAGCVVNMNLLEAAALLHDIARNKPNHAEVGAELLRREGFSDPADIVAVHKDITPPENGPVTEREIVHLADKCVKGNVLVSLEERFAESSKRYRRDPEITKAVEIRQQNALRLWKRFEEQTGQSPEEVFALAGFYPGEVIS